jgi:hypothetical protein
MKLGFMPMTIFQSLVAQLPDTATIMPFWRGESTLHPRFNELMIFARYWASKGKIILATNAMFLESSLLGIMAAHVVNVSIHNNVSYQGLLKILKKRETYNPKLHVTASMVEGEKTGVQPAALKIADEVRIYKEHTKKGVWGKVDGWPKPAPSWCYRLDTDLVIAWDGQVSRCCYVWDPIPGLNAYEMTVNDILDSPQMKKIRENYPDKTCRACSQWQGQGRTI